MDTHAPPIATRSPSAAHWLAVAAVIAAGAVATIQIGKTAPALPLIRDELGIGMITGGWVSSIINLTGALFGLALGIVADRAGHRRVVLASLACLAVGSLAGSFATTATALLASRFVEGIGYVAIVICGTPLIVAATKPQRSAVALGIWSAYFPMGMITLMLGASALLGTIGWRTLWWITAALCLVVLLLVLRAVPAPAIPPKGRVAFADVLATVRRPGPWCLAGILTIKSFASFSLMMWLPTFLVEDLGRSLGTSALMTAGFIALFIPANITGGWLIRRNPARAWRVMAVAALGIAVFPAGIFSGDLPEGARIALAVCYNATAGLIPGALYATMPAHAPTPQQIGAVGGLIVQGATFGNLIGPPLLAAFVLAFGGWSAAPLLYFGLGGMGLLLALGLRSAERRLAAH